MTYRTPHVTRRARDSRHRGVAAAAFLVIAGLCQSSACPAAGTVATGYAALVRRVSPSVVTVMVEEKSVSAGQRAAERANPDREADAVGMLIRRLLSGAVGNPGSALLKVDAGPLTALRLGSSHAASVGDAVIAIGNPFGLGQSVSAGIISARARTLEDDPYIDFLQTDAAINRGNSGGPLLALDGTVLGVTSAIFSPSGGSVGLGFAIPAETVSAVIGDLEAHGRVDRGYLGISAEDPTLLIAKALGMKTATGALVTAVDAQGPAVGALWVGDVLLKLGALPVTFKNLSKITARLTPNALVVIVVLRDGKQQPVAMTIGRLPDPPADPALTGDQDTWIPALRLGVAETTAAIRTAIKAHDESGGLIVTQLRPAGPGSLAGLKVGDLLTHVGTQPLVGIADLANIAVPTAQTPLLLRVVRDGNATFIAVTGEAELNFP
jgi:serine protease Do